MAVFPRTTRDFQIRLNSLKLEGSKVLIVDGMGGPNTRAQIAHAMKLLGYTREGQLFHPDGINRIHWHWTGSSYSVTWDVRRRYNNVFDKDGNEYDGGAPAQQQAAYMPYKVGVSHTLSGNTGAIGLAVAAMGNASEGGGRVDQGKWPLTWEGIDAMLKKTMDYCKVFGIKVSPWTTLTHAEVQTNIGIRQNGKWDIRCLPDNPTKLLGTKECGDILRARMLERFS